MTRTRWTLALTAPMALLAGGSAPRAGTPTAATPPG